MSEKKTVIIGAGPAGLTAAYELNKLGKNSVILEADCQVGGISKTVDYQGNRFDIGGHRFFSKVPYINQIWEEILEKDLLTCNRISRILYNKHFFDYPLKPLNALTGLGIQEAVSVILSFARVKLLPWEHRPDSNFEQWVINRFGSKLYEIFFKTYTEKVWGIPCTEISADWASQRIRNFSLPEAIRNAFFNSGKDPRGEVITTIIDQFKYPRFGPGMMWERCMHLLEQSHNPTLLGQQAISIVHKNRTVSEVITRDASGVQTSFTGDHFISSMPLRELILALQPLPPADIIQAAQQLRYRDYFTAVLVIDRKDVFPDNWIYIHTPEVKLGRIQNYKNWSAAMINNPNHTTLGLEYFLWEKDEEWNWPDQRLIELGIKECTRIGIIQPNQVIDGAVVRMKKAYPVYDHDYIKNLEVIRNYLSAFTNLQTIGRNGLHRYNNQDHSMLTGIYAARNTMGKEYDVWTVNTEQEYHEEKERNNRANSDRMIPQPIKS